jgi:hypothetical protein
MAYLFGDGMDIYAGSSDLLSHWDSLDQSGNTANIVLPASSTAFGIGGALATIANFGGFRLSRTLGASVPTLFASLRLKRTTISSGNYFYLSWQDGGSNQVTVRWNEDGSLSAHTGGPTGPQLQMVTGVYPQNVWESWQMKIVVHDTAGSVEIRKNGGVTPVLLVSAGNTRGGTSVAQVNQVLVGTSNGGVVCHLDDVLVWSASGAAPNDWVGDVRAVTLAPANTVQAQWSAGPAAIGNITQTTTRTESANVIAAYLYQSPALGLASSIGVTLMSGITGSLTAALYADANGVPGALIASGSSVSSPAAGVVTIPLQGAPVTVPQGPVWVALWSSASCTFAAGASTSRAGQSLVYGGAFPNPLVAGTPGAAAAPVLVLPLADPAPHSLLRYPMDGDTGYVYGATVGSQDLYGVETLASKGVAPASIVGVAPFALLKRSDSGARTVQVIVRSAASETAAASSTAVPLSYRRLGGFLSADPATGGAWTSSAVNALLVGPRIAA